MASISSYPRRSIPTVIATSGSYPVPRLRNMKTTKPMPAWLRAMVPTKSRPSDHSASPLPTLPDLPEPPADLHPRTLDLVRRGVDEIARAPNGAQENTLNTSAFRIGRLVGAGAIGIEDACRPLENAGVAMRGVRGRRGI
jgi:hypothetical protein